MKKLLTNELGGHPFYFKDLEFLQEQVRELTKANFGRNLDADVTILHGGKITVSTDGYTVSVTAGYAYYNGQYYYIPAHESTGSSPDVAKWVVEQSYDPRGLKKFFEPSVGYKDVYLVETLMVAFLPTSVAGVPISDTKFLDNSTPWEKMTPEGSWINPPAPAPPFPLFDGIYVRRNYEGNLEFKGSFHFPVGATWHGLLFILPDNLKTHKGGYGNVNAFPFLSTGDLGGFTFHNTDNGEVVLVVQDAMKPIISAVYLNYTLFV